MKNRSSIITITGIIAIVILGFYAITSYVTINREINLMKRQQILSDAVDNCAAFARSIKDQEFIQFLYRSCLLDKNYKTNLTE